MSAAVAGGTSYLMYTSNICATLYIGKLTGIILAYFPAGLGLLALHLVFAR